MTEYQGIDLLGVPLVNADYEDLTAGDGLATGQFSVDGDSFYAWSSEGVGGIVPANDDSPDFGVFSSTREGVFAGETFASMGLDVHSQNTPVGLWAARVGAGDTETVNFVVSSVPEPSAFLLGLVVLLAICFNRRRTAFDAQNLSAND